MFHGDKALLGISYGIDLIWFYAELTWSEGKEPSSREEVPKQALSPGRSPAGVGIDQTIPSSFMDTLPPGGATIT